MYMDLIRKRRGPLLEVESRVLIKDIRKTAVYKSGSDPKSLSTASLPEI